MLIMQPVHVIRRVVITATHNGFIPATVIPGQAAIIAHREAVMRIPVHTVDIPEQAAAADMVMEEVVIPAAAAMVEAVIPVEAAVQAEGALPAAVAAVADTQAEAAGDNFIKF